MVAFSSLEVKIMQVVWILPHVQQGSTFLYTQYIGFREPGDTECQFISSHHIIIHIDLVNTERTD